MVNTKIVASFVGCCARPSMYCWVLLVLCLALALLAAAEGLCLSSFLRTKTWFIVPTFPSAPAHGTEWVQGYNMANQFLVRVLSHDGACSPSTATLDIAESFVIDEPSLCSIDDESPGGWSLFNYNGANATRAFCNDSNCRML